MFDPKQKKELRLNRNSLIMSAVWTGLNLLNPILSNFT